MDLQEFSSGAAQFNAHPTVKSWLNIVAGSVAANSIVTPSLFAQVFGFGSVSTINTGGNLTAAQVVNGVAGGVSPGGILFLPSASDLNTFIGAVPPSIPFYNFVFRFSNSPVTGGNWQLNPGSGTVLFDGQAHIIINAGVDKAITFAFTPGGWVIYY